MAEIGEVGRRSVGNRRGAVRTPGRVEVEAVHGVRHRRLRAEVRAQPRERRVAAQSMGRCARQPGWLAHGDERGVLVQDLKRQVLGRRRDGVEELRDRVSIPMDQIAAHEHKQSVVTSGRECAGMVTCEATSRSAQPPERPMAAPGRQAPRSGAAAPPPEQEADIWRPPGPQFGRPAPSPLGQAGLGSSRPYASDDSCPTIRCRMTGSALATNACALATNGCGAAQVCLCPVVRLCHVQLVACGPSRRGWQTRVGQSSARAA